MSYRRVLIIIAIALGLAACSSYPSAYHDRAVYRDGSYYSRAGDGYGDYYYAPQPSDYDYPGYYGPSYFSYSYGNCWSYRGCSPWGFSGYWGPYSRSGPSIFYRHGGWSGSYWAPYSHRDYRRTRQSRPAPRPRMTPDDRRHDDRQPRFEPRRPRGGSERPPTNRERGSDRAVPMAATTRADRLRDPGSAPKVPRPIRARLPESGTNTVEQP